MRVFLILSFTLALITRAQASCECRCVGGETQALCSSSIDIPPICPTTVCPIPLPSIAPIRPSGLPPLGTTQCSQQQVLNPSTHQYEWRRVCN